MPTRPIVEGVATARRSFSPLVLAPVEAGFPSPAGDYRESPLDLNEHLIPHPASTFFVHVRGHSMQGAAILNNDLLIVDRSLDPQSGDIVIAAVDGELTVKRLVRQKETVRLEAANPSYRPIVCSGEQGAEIWGVVTYVIHTIR